jgi:hypothetical protein
VRHCCLSGNGGYRTLPRPCDLVDLVDGRAVSVSVCVNLWLFIRIYGFWSLDSEFWTIRPVPRLAYGRSADFSSNFHVGGMKASPFTAPTPSA